MSLTISNNTFKSVLVLALLISLYAGISDPHIFRYHFYGDKPFSFFDFMAEFWPLKILTVLGLFAAYLSLFYIPLQKKLNNLNVSGNILIPILFSLFAVPSIALLWEYHIYDSNRSIEKTDQIFWLLVYTMFSGWAYLLYLFYLNKYFSKSASLSIFVILFFASLYCLKVWASYILTGHVNFA